MVPKRACTVQVPADDGPLVSVGVTDQRWSRGLTHAGNQLPSSARTVEAMDAWARYVQEHPYAPRMFFHETTGDPQIAAVHREVQASSQAALGAILGAEPGGANIAGGDELELEMAAEVIRAGLTGLAIWWIDHPEVPRERIVETAVNALWIGFERVRSGERWSA